MKSLIRNLNPRRSERRLDQRYALSGSLPGPLTAPGEEEITAMPVDLSRRGLGLLIEPAPPIGTTITLAFEPTVINGTTFGTIEFVVRHVHETPIKTVSGLFEMKRCGVELVDPTNTLDLVHILSKFDSLIIQE